MKTMEKQLLKFKDHIGKDINGVMGTQVALKEDVKFVMSNQLKLQDQMAEVKEQQNEVTGQLDFIVKMLSE